MPRDGTANLTPVKTKEEARIRGSAGGKKSGEVRRRKRELKEILELLLDTAAEKGNGTKADEIAIALYHEAQNGNVKAFEVIRDTIGQKPVEKVQAQVDMPQFVNDLDE